MFKGCKAKISKSLLIPLIKLEFFSLHFLSVLVNQAKLPRTRVKVTNLNWSGTLYDDIRLLLINWGLGLKMLTHLKHNIYVLVFLVIHNIRDVLFGCKVGQISTNGTNSRLFKDQISVQCTFWIPKCWLGLIFILICSLPLWPVGVSFWHV